MKQSSLNEIIQAERSRILPSCPGNLESNVLRHIRLSQNDAQTTALGLLSRVPALFALTVGVALLSTATALSFSSAKLKQAQQREYALQALDFDLLNDPGLQAASRSAKWRMK